MTILKISLIILIGLYLFVGIGLYVFQEKFVFRPEPLPKDFSYSFDQPTEEIFITMNDGAIINGLHFKPESPKGIIVYFHGNAGNLNRWGKIVSPFTTYGQEVIVIDYRGYGKSTGNRTKDRMLLDAEEIFMYVKEKWPEEKITLYGRSLGCTFASYLAGNHNPAQVILESPFHSIVDIGGRAGWIYPLKSLLRYDFNNAETLKTAGCPITIIHGTDDEVVPFDSGEKLYDGLNPSKARFVAIANGGHNDLSEFEEYWEAMDDVFK